MIPRWLPAQASATLLTCVAFGFVSCSGNVWMHVVCHGPGCPADAGSNGDACASNLECASACIAGRCADLSPIGGACDEAADCVAGLMCQASLCVIDTAGPRVVYRSVGPGNTAPLATGTGNALRIAASVATFASPLPARVGVGDVIVYSFDGSPQVNRAAFISSRASASVFGVQGVDGGPATDTTSPDTRWSLMRAYTSLADAVYGSENAALPAGLANFDPFTNGKDLVAANQVWNIACYADAADDVGAQSVWVTGA
jgi:hypothetical protein